MQAIQSIENILFLDIETVPACPSWAVLPDKMKKLWDKKSSGLRKENETAEDLYNRAGIYAEFGKIICISAGFFTRKDGHRSFRVKSFAGDDEASVLLDYRSMLEKFCRDRKAQLCAHNGKEFDFPYIARRMIVNQVPIPDILDVAGKKPWEVNFLDTMELWRFGDFKSYTSLELLTTLFGIPTPKDDIDGSQVAGVYYESHDLARISRYCEKDVVAVAQLLLRYNYEKILEETEIEIVN